MNVKLREMNQKTFTITMLLEQKFEVNAIGINTAKNLLDIF